jgi:Raf kinase inhibitor-like YbhB/YbcL family protein
MTDFGRPGYGGPCPPAGDKPHRYIFTVYAVKVDQLPLKKDASGAMVGFYLNQNVLAKASLTALYGR